MNFSEPSFSNWNFPTLKSPKPIFIKNNFQVEFQERKIAFRVSNSTELDLYKTIKSRCCFLIGDYAHNENLTLMIPPVD